ncbi:MAG: hypothetical protein FJW20_09830 [Acidimicrobiia bacterium]|nr:hypothetical protein [Acidimicrobiia bacterium]
MWKRFRWSLLLLTVSIVVSIGMAEVLLRLWGYRFSGSNYQKDPVLGWSLRPGSECWEAEEGIAWNVINSHGFRDRERTIQKPSGTYRIAVLGDSIAEGRGVALEDVFTAVLERKLNDCPAYRGRKVEVLNFGVPGYGTAQELLQFRHTAAAYSPDLVILQFYAGNDMFNNIRELNVSDADSSPYFLLKDGKLVADNSFRERPSHQEAAIRRKNFAANLMNSSHLALMLYKLVRVRAQQAVPGQTLPASEGPPKNFPSIYPYLPPQIPAMEQAWAVTEALIEEFHREVTSRGTGFQLIVLPLNGQIHPDLEVRRRLQEHMGVPDLYYPDRRLEELTSRAKIDYFSLTKPMGDYAVKNQVYLSGFVNTAPGDGHPNEKGHRLIADLLHQRLCQ